MFGSLSAIEQASVATLATEEDSIPRPQYWPALAPASAALGGEQRVARAYRTRGDRFGRPGPLPNALGAEHNVALARYPSSLTPLHNLDPSSRSRHYLMQLTA